MPCICPGATYVKCRREGHVASTAIGCESGGGMCWAYPPWMPGRMAPGSPSWSRSGQGVLWGIQLVVSDAHEGLKSAMAEVFQGAAWQRCAVHPMRGCMRAAGSKGLARRVARIVAPVSRAKDAAAVCALCHATADMLEGCCPKAAAVWEDAEADAPACPGLPASRWKRLEASSV